MMPKLRADVGAIKFVLSGANIMCPGLTSPGATIHDEVGEDCPVGERPCPSLPLAPPAPLQRTLCHAASHLPNEIALARHG